MAPRIHHLNLLVADLDNAVRRWRDLGVAEFLFEDLPGRGVRTARCRLGETWLVLVQPNDPDSVPGQWRQQHGEGMFLLSLATDDLTHQAQRLGDRGLAVGSTRHGLSDWQVFDVEGFDAGSLTIQYCESESNGARTADF